MSIELGGNTVPQLPAIANVPYGMDFGGANINPATLGAALQQGAGWSVADIGTVDSNQYDDFLIGAPTTLPGNPSALGSLPGSAVYLVLGSQTAPNPPTVTDGIGKTGTVLNYTPNDRVGDLGQLGLSPQTNPIPPPPAAPSPLGFPFAGVTFFNGTYSGTDLGASVAGLKVNGVGAILLGAPGAPDASGLNPGTGRAYLLWGNFVAQIGKSVNLDLSAAAFAAAYPGLNLVTFVNSMSPGEKLGFSVAGGSNILGDGLSDVILGAPSATVNVSAGGTGAVYVDSVTNVSAGVSTVDVSTLGTNNTSVILVGANSGDQAGFSVADAGNVNGAAGSVDDLLIGAPTAGGGAGAAYLVYGGSGLGNLATVTPPNTARFINLNRVGITGATSVPGAVFNGVPGGATGYSVNSAGDFNGDGIGDIMIGSPFATEAGNANAGQVNVFYGAKMTSANFLTGTYNLANLPTTAPPNFVLTGADAGDMAGYAVAFTGIINAGQPNTILIGAPGFNSNSGTAYLIPGRASFTGSFPLSASELPGVLQGLQFTLTNTPTANFFGASLASRFQNGQTFTADGDSEADFIIGAPGYDVTQTPGRTQAGGAMIIQSGLITVPIPTVAAITTTIGVGTPFAPFSINNTTPAALQIFVFGTTTTTPNFLPVVDINPATVVVNGVAFPTATIAADPNVNNHVPANIPDAIITISPRSLLNLTAGTTTTITISGSTLASSPFGVETWTGSATPVTITGGSVSPVVSGVVGLAPGPVTETTFNGAFGNTQFVPTISQLSAYNYQPIPINVALNQFLAAPGFRDRNYSFNHPGKHLNVDFQSRGQPIGRVGGFNQLRKSVFTRGRFHPQKLYTWKHKPAKYGSLTGVVPVQDSVQRYQDIQLTGG